MSPVSPADQDGYAAVSVIPLALVFDRAPASLPIGFFLAVLEDLARRGLRTPDFRYGHLDSGDDGHILSPSHVCCNQITAQCLNYVRLKER